MKYKGIIFDLDGTLIDSMSVWDHVGKDFLIGQGIHPPQDLNDRIKNMSFEQSARYFEDAFGLSLTVKEIIAEFNRLAEHQYKYFISLKPYVREFLEKAKKRDIKMCIATANDKILTTYVLNRSNSTHYFEFILTSEEVGSGKDNPEIYKQAARKLGYPIEDIVVFEDALYCIKTAKSIGLDVVGVDDPSSKEQEAIKGYSDYFINSFQDLQGWFD